jgi:hypothetical protein
MEDIRVKCKQHSQMNPAPVVLSGAENSSACTAASNSMASTRSTFCTTSSALRADMPPMLVCAHRYMSQN